MEWLKIETAPKIYGVCILVCIGDTVAQVVWTRRRNVPDRWEHFMGEKLRASPTHWMALPVLPKKWCTSYKELFSPDSVTRMIARGIK